MLLKKNFIQIIEEEPKVFIKYISDENNFQDMSNYILYGPACSFKYKNCLKLLQYYSNTNLKYEKKIVIQSTKNEFIIKISDIHYEIDIAMLFYNTKQLWNDIMSVIVNIIQCSEVKKGFIVLKNFHKINNELLNIIYSYMQKDIINTNINIKFIIISESISFIPDNILNISKILYFSKLGISNYQRNMNKNNKKFFIKNNSEILNINNTNILKSLDINDSNINILYKHKSICDNLINKILSPNFNIIELRNTLYDILILNLNIYECIYYIIQKLINDNYIKKEKLSKLIIKTLSFLKQYNNNYRPIFHLESYLLYLLSLIDVNN